MRDGEVDLEGERWEDCGGRWVLVVQVEGFRGL